MFVSKSKYDKIRGELYVAISVIQIQDEQIRQYTKVMQDIEKRGLLSGGIPQEDIKSLLRLCHPDKHPGDKNAENMTVKLLEMRKK